MLGEKETLPESKSKDSSVLYQSQKRPRTTTFSAQTSPVAASRVSMAARMRAPSPLELHLGIEGPPSFSVNEYGINLKNDAFRSAKTGFAYERPAGLMSNSDMHIISEFSLPGTAQHATSFLEGKHPFIPAKPQSVAGRRYNR